MLCIVRCSEHFILIGSTLSNQSRLRHTDASVSVKVKHLLSALPSGCNIFIYLAECLLLFKKFMGLILVQYFVGAPSLDDGASFQFLRYRYFEMVPSTRSSMKDNN